MTVIQMNNPDEVFTNEEQDYMDGSAYAVAIINQMRAGKYSAEYLEGFLDAMADYMNE